MTQSRQRIFEMWQCEKRALAQGWGRDGAVFAIAGKKIYSATDWWSVRFSAGAYLYV
jgi:hypothetical protein